MSTAISPKLHRFFIPQVEQLDMTETPLRFGSQFEIDREIGSGKLWVANVGDGCLLSSLSIQVTDDIDLVSYPDDYVCLSTMRRENIRVCPIPQTFDLQDENIVGFAQKAGPFSYTIHSDAPYCSQSISFTKDFFRQAEAFFPEETPLLKERLTQPSVNNLPIEAGSILRSLSAARANRADAMLFFSSRVLDVVRIIVEDAMEEKQAQAAAESSSSRSLVQEAQRLIEANLGKDLSVTLLAQQLYVSKTRLCAVFKQETGLGVAEYIRSRRMDTAAELLLSTGLSVAEIAHAVGYPRQSSFTDAFRLCKAMSPTQWRQTAKF